LTVCAGSKTRNEETAVAILEVKSLSKYYGGFHALEDLDLRIDPGSIWAIIGPNGAGKSTLFNLISGLLRPSKGEMYFKGIRLSGMKPNQRTALGIAFTFQNLRLFPKMTVLENLLVGRNCRIRANLGKVLFRPPFRQLDEEKKARVFSEDVLDFVGLRRRKDDLVSNLSFGERHLVALARSLATDPELLLLDEPSAGLNPQETVILRALLKKLNENGKTICFIEHDMDMVMEMSDMITVLNFGVKIAEGSPSAVKTNSKVIEAYLGAEED
jgi:branched-chain amino acid transport system ATP-binding protein